MALKPVKILHCADLHISGEEHTDAFERIIEICRLEKVEFLLIAGDLFDRINIPRKVQDKIISLISGVPDTMVAISPGNHDPYSADSCYNLREWPSNTRIFRGELSPTDFTDKGVRLWGCGFTSNYAEGLWKTSSASAEEAKNLINICVIHGDIDSQVSESPYDLIPIEFIRGSGFDYLALGHVHKRSEIAKTGKTFYAYSGCPSARGFDETGDLGVYIGEIAEGSCDLEFRRINEIRFLVEEITLDKYTSDLDTSEMILNDIRNRYPQTYMKDRFKIILRGKIRKDACMNIMRITEHLNRSLTAPRLEDRTVRLPDYDAIAGESSLKGLFVSGMLTRLAAAETERSADEIFKALEYGMLAFEGEVKIDEDHIDID